LQQLVDNLRIDLNKEEKCNDDLLQHLNEMVIMMIFSKVMMMVICSAGVSVVQVNLL